MKCSQLAVSQLLKKLNTQDPTNPFLGIYPREPNTYVQHRYINAHRSAIQSSQKVETRDQEMNG